MPKKELPMRMCVVTREMLPKNELIRMVSKNGELIVDLTQKKDGRGFWITKSKDVVLLARHRKTLNKILHKNVDEKIYDLLLEVCE